MLLSRTNITILESSQANASSLDKSFPVITWTNKAVEADDTYNALSDDLADNTLTDLDVSSAMDINIVGDNDINMLDSLDDFDNLDSDEINSSEE